MKAKKLLLILTVLLAISGCAGKEDNHRAKYVFLFIGDGMGIQQVNSAKVYSDSVLNDTAGVAFTKFPVASLANTYAANRYITCSAAAGTALSTGHKTSIGTLGLTANHKDTLYSIAKKFKGSGRKVAILTSVSIDHATPAAFYAHNSSRNSYYDIAKYLISSNYDFFASGGFLEPYGPKNDSSAASIYELGAENGVSFTSTFSGIDSLRRIENSKIVYSAPNPAKGSSLQYEIDRGSDDISLADITRKAIEFTDNPNGFFMMVEGGKIDWACHDNDAATAIYEVLAFSDAVNVALAFYQKHPDETLIVITADHETGGMSLGNNSNGYDNHLTLLKGQKLSQEKLHGVIDGLKLTSPKPSFGKVLLAIEAETGLTADGEFALTPDELAEFKHAYDLYFGNSNSTRQTYSDTDILAKAVLSVLNKKAGIGWTSSSHTGSPVPVFALGAGQELFSPLLDNTDIPKNIVKASGIGK
ncbi:MAG: alkaline phosphatase [Bacteroidales bacterium]